MTYDKAIPLSSAKLARFVCSLRDPKCNDGRDVRKPQLTELSADASRLAPKLARGSDGTVATADDFENYLWQVSRRSL
jgi:hypothetical protein